MMAVPGVSHDPVASGQQTCRKPSRVPKGAGVEAVCLIRVGQALRNGSDPTADRAQSFATTFYIVRIRWCL